MRKQRLLLLAAPLLAVASLGSLTACNKHYDLVIYNWEDYIYSGEAKGGKIVDKGIVDRFVSYYEEKHGKTATRTDRDRR